jgi:DNA repair photolyase
MMVVAMSQAALFPDLLRPRVLPVLGSQKDITYHDTFARSILNDPEVTKMGFWSINPYVGCAFGCAYCYARYTHRYVMERAVTSQALDGETEQDVARIPPWLAFERHIVVKRNAPAILRRTLRHGSDKHRRLIEGETIVIGTATDPYQPAERRFRITRGILEALSEHPGLDVVVITKSPLITRDIDLLVRLMRHCTVSVHISLITLDRQLARRLEPRAPTPDSRVRALERLREAGIEAGINCMPVLPGITDNPRDLEALVRRVAEAGATYVGACALRLRHEARQRYLPFIAQEFPQLSERYQAAYARGHHVSERYREGLARFFAQLCAKYGVQNGSMSDEEDDTGDTALAPADAQLALVL